MKKLKWLGFTFVAILMLTACGSNEEVATPAEETEEVDTAEVKSAIMREYLNMTTIVNGVDKDLTDYMVSEATLEGEELQTAKDSAAVAAANAAAELEKIELSDELGSYKEQVEGAFTTLKESYEMKAEELRKDESNMDAANEKFAEAEKTLGDLLEEVGLVRTSLDKDLNS